MAVAAVVATAGSVAAGVTFGVPGSAVSTSDGAAGDSPPSDRSVAATAAPPPTPAAPPTPAPAAAPEVALPSCADFDSADAAVAAVAADPSLAEVLDTDGDGRPCELRFAPPPAPAPAPQASPPAEDDTCPSSGFGGVLEHVARAGHFLAARFGIPTTAIGGVGARANRSFHPGGRALDFSVDRATGDELAGYVLDHMDELGVIEVIWRQRINFGSGWELMEDRGGVTANHYDHVHLSFAADPPAVSLSC